MVSLYREREKEMKYKDRFIWEDPEFSIGFVGDIMMLRGHELKFDHPIKNFFKDVPPPLPIER